MTVYTEHKLRGTNYRFSYAYKRRRETREYHVLLVVSLHGGVTRV